MTVDEFLSDFSSYAEAFKLPFSAEDFSHWAAKVELVSSDLMLIGDFFNAMIEKRDNVAVSTLKRLSRIPQKAPKTFGNFDTSLLNERDRKFIASLETLFFINAKKNIVMIGPTGTGKTHLAMAIGNACCESKRKAYFIKMKELKDKLKVAIAKGTEEKLLSALTKYSCLIIDEVGYCQFTKEETLLFFHLSDRMSVKETGSIIFTSNKDTNEWHTMFDEDDATENALDRLLDKVICLQFSGASHRGRERDYFELKFQKLK